MPSFALKIISNTLRGSPSTDDTSSNLYNNNNNDNNNNSNTNNNNNNDNDVGVASDINLRNIFATATFSSFLAKFCPIQFLKKKMELITTVSHYRITRNVQMDNFFKKIAG